MNAKDFKVGQTVWVEADQGLRKGTVTKTARTRVTVKHPRNKRGDLVERAYTLERIVVGKRPRASVAVRQIAVYADGSEFETWKDLTEVPWAEEGVNR